MSELINKMNQQFTDMQKLAQDFAAMAEQAIIERDAARVRVARLEGALRRLVSSSTNAPDYQSYSVIGADVSYAVALLEGK